MVYGGRFISRYVRTVGVWMKNGKMGSSKMDMHMTREEQIRRFKEMFAPRLTSEGFFWSWRRRSFFRLGDKVFIQILWGPEYHTVWWRTVPFTEGFTVETLRTQPLLSQNMYPLLPWIIRDGEIDIRRGYEIAPAKHLQVNCRVFFEDVFDGLNKVHDIQTELTFMQTVMSIGDPAGNGFCHARKWSYLFLEQYEAVLEWLRTQGTKGEERRLLEAKDYGPIRDEVRLRLELSHETCQEYFGKKYTGTI